MNVRNLIKLIDVEISRQSGINYDNPYECRIDIAHGPVDMPFHDAVSLTNQELKLLACNMGEVLSKINDFLTDNVT